MSYSADAVAGAVISIDDHNNLRKDAIHSNQLRAWMSTQKHLENGTTTLIFENTTINEDNLYNTTTGVFTANKNMNVLISCKISINDSLSEEFTMQIFQSGLTYPIAQKACITANSAYEGIAITQIAHLNSGDTITIKMVNPSGVTKHIEGAASDRGFNWLTISGLSVFS